MMRIISSIIEILSGNVIDDYCPSIQPVLN